MAIIYSLVQRPVMAGPDKDMIKTYGQVRSGEKVDFKRICKQVEQISAATAGDVKLVIDGLLTVICENLESGQSTQIGDLGSFRMTAGSEGLIDKEDFSAHIMKRPRVVFTPGRDLTRMLKELQYTRKDHLTNEVKIECDLQHIP